MSIWEAWSLFWLFEIVPFPTFTYLYIAPFFVLLLLFKQIVFIMCNNKCIYFWNEIYSFTFKNEFIQMNSFPRRLLKSNSSKFFFYCLQCQNCFVKIFRHFYYYYFFKGHWHKKTNILLIQMLKKTICVRWQELSKLPHSFETSQ